MTAALEPSRKQYSLEEFFAWVHKYGKADAQYELINGEIMEKDADTLAGPDRGQSKVIAWLIFHLLTFSNGKTAEVFSAPPCTLGVNIETLNPNIEIQEEGNISSINNGKRTRKQAKKTRTNYVLPDVAVFLTGRLTPGARGPIPEIPDIVAEVNSPSDTTESIADKIEVYQKAGVPLIWSIYLLAKFVRVYYRQANGSYKPDTVDLDDELDDKEVLPGFKLKVNRLFE